MAARLAMTEEEIETLTALQTRQRIFQGNTRTEDKLFSVFEPSTEIIRKGKA
ncbi:hypothetical protein IVA82_35815, partial [Bradyrhizobium sp. 142]|nr:hypothetical protein [Bradyrhizobium sp. 142]